MITVDDEYDQSLEEYTAHLSKVDNLKEAIEEQDVIVFDLDEQARWEMRKLSKLRRQLEEMEDV